MKYVSQVSMHVVSLVAEFVILFVKKFCDARCKRAVLRVLMRKKSQILPLLLKIHYLNIYTKKHKVLIGSGVLERRSKRPVKTTSWHTSTAILLGIKVHRYAANIPCFDRLKIYVKELT